MIKIFINALSALQGGGQTYLINIFKYRKKGDYKIYLLVNKKNRDIFLSFEDEDFVLIEDEIASGNILKRIWYEKCILSKLLETLDIDIYYAPGGSITTKTPKKCKKVTIFRNMLPLQKDAYQRYPLGYMRFRLMLLKYLFLRSYKNADNVIFISNYAQSVIQKYIPSIKEKSCVIYHGLDENFLTPSNSIENIPTYEYYLYVSTVDVYKAQWELVEAWKVLRERYSFDKKLLLIGPSYPYYEEQMRQKIEKYNLTNDVIYLGKVPYESLPKYYQSAKALIFASSCENCPNILLEMMASKKIIFCSNYQPMPEFAKDSVVYFDPYNVDELVTKIIENSNTDNIELSSKAYQYALEFSWKETSQRTFDYLVKE